MDEARGTARPVLTKTKSVQFFIKRKNDNVEYIDAKNHAIKCGDIWMAKLPETDGSVQSGYRPVFVISNDKNNQYSTVLNVIPFTTKMNKRNLPCHVEIWDYKKYGLLAPSTLMVEQLSTIKKENLMYHMGEIRDANMLAMVYLAMKAQFPILAGK